MRPAPPSATRIASAVIVLGIGLQCLAVSRLTCPPRALGLPRLACAPALWPFLDYPMFSAAHGPGASVEHDVVVLGLESGDERRIAPGSDQSGRLARALVAALHGEHEDEIRAFVREHERASGARVCELRLERERFVLTRAGFLEEPPLVLRRLEPARDRITQ